MLQDYGSVYNFFPKSFVIPEDYVSFATEHGRRQGSDCPDAKNMLTICEQPTQSITSSSETIVKLNVPSASVNIVTAAALSKDSSSKKNNGTGRHPVWIIKPIGRSQGKGIILTTDIGHLAHGHKCVVQGSRNTKLQTSYFKKIT